MRSTLGFLGVFVTLISIAQSLSCIQCIGMSSSSCTGSSVTCLPGYLCGTSYTKTSAFGMEVSELHGRDCAPKSICNMAGSMSMMSHIRNQIVLSCCETDNCTPPEIKFPALSTEFNGLVCPTCVSTNSVWCNTEETIQCSGNETMCLLQTNKIIGARPFQTAIRGCATKTICDIGTLSASGDINMHSDFICTNGNGGSYN